MKKKPTPPPKSREQHRLKTRLALRERQFQEAVKALKWIINFKSAHLSVFETEVHELQRMALESLCTCEGLQRGKPVYAMPLGRDLSRLRDKIGLSSLYGKFTRSEGSDEDE